MVKLGVEYGVNQTFQRNHSNENFDQLRKRIWTLENLKKSIQISSKCQSNITRENEHTLSIKVNNICPCYWDVGPMWDFIVWMFYSWESKNMLMELGLVHWPMHHPSHIIFQFGPAMCAESLVYHLHHHPFSWRDNGALGLGPFGILEATLRGYDLVHLP